MKYIFALVIGCSFVINSCTEPTAKDQLQMILNRNDLSSSYMVSKQSKPLFQEDTTYQEFKIIIEKNSNDSIYGYNFFIEGKYSQYIYAKDTLYTFNLLDSTVRKKRTLDKQLNKLILPNHNLRYEDIRDTINIYIEQDDEKILLSKRYDDNGEVKNIRETYKISKNQKIINSITTKLTFQDSEQYDHYVFENYQKNPSANISTLLIKKLKLFEKYKNYVAKDLRLDHVIDFKGLPLNGKDPISTSQYDAELIILDYWYMACYPCIKSIPLLNSITEKYNEKDIQVVGINIVDTLESKINKLEAFKLQHKIKYPLLLTKENPYGVNQFPTVIIINKKQEIIYHHYGYNKKIKNDLLKILETQLNKKENN